MEQTECHIGRWHRGVALVCLTVLIGGCQSDCVSLPGSTTQAPEAAAMGPRDVTFVMPAAERYSVSRKETPFDKRIARALVGTQGEGLAVDPCLSLSATEFARHIHPAPDGAIHLSKDLQAAVLHHAGCTDGWVASHLFFSSASKDADFFEHLDKVLADVGDATHIGVGRAKAQSPYKWAYAVFMAERHAEFTPIPRHMESGESLKVAGKLDKGLESPRVLIMAPGGDVVDLEVSLGKGRRFEASSPMGGSVGEHWVELLANGELGPRVVALFPVYVGAEPPKGVRIEPPPDESMVQTESDAEQLMFKLLNADRRRFGLPPLTWNEELAEIARGHSRDMHDNAFFAHISPRRGTLEDRFSEAGFAARNLAENISRNNSVYDAQDGLMISLGHRANILSPNFEMLGVGVVFAKDEYGRRIMHFTQNFATPQRSLTGAEFKKAVLKKIDRHREARSMPVLRRPKALQSVAARHARFTDPSNGGQSTNKVSQKVRAALRDRRFTYRTFYIQTHSVLDPEDVQIPEAAERAHVRSIGVGAFPVKQPTGTILWKTLIVLTEN